MTNQTPATTGQNKQVSKVELLKGILNAPSVQEQFNNALKENKGSFVASIIDLYNTDANLQQCEPKQVVMEALKAAVLKLPINKALGFAYIIPFNNNKKQPNGQWVKVMEPQFQLGYKGYIQMAMRTGQYRTINADMVFEGELKVRNKLTGEIDFSGERTGDKVIGFFAYIELLNGFSKTLYMTKEQVLTHAKKYSKSFSGENSVWKKEEDAMCLKTVLRNLLSHYGFLSVEMMSAFESDQDLPEDQNTPEVSANKQVIDIDSEEVPEQPEQPKQPGPEF